MSQMLKVGQEFQTGNNTDRERRKKVFFKEYFHLTVAEMRYIVT